MDDREKKKIWHNAIQAKNDKKMVEEK